MNINYLTPSPHIQALQPYKFLGKCNLTPPLYLVEFEHCFHFLYPIIMV